MIKIHYYCTENGHENEVLLIGLLPFVPRINDILSMHLLDGWSSLWRVEHYCIEFGDDGIFSHIELFLTSEGGME